MSNKLRVCFDDPNDKWIGIELKTEDQELSINAGYPGSALHGLIGALQPFNEFSQSEIIWDSEPTLYQMNINRHEEKIKLIIVRKESKSSEEIMSLNGSFEEICIPFWRALRLLQEKFSQSELQDKCGEFPFDELNALNKSIKEWKKSLA